MPFRAIGLGNDNTTLTGDSSFDISVDGSVQAGDVMSVVATMNTNTNTFSISGGGTVTWTLRDGPTTINSNLRAYLWTATAASNSAGSTITIDSVGGGGRFIGILEVQYGVTETGMVWGLTQDATSDTSLVWPTLSLTETSELVGLGAMRVAAATAATMTIPSGSTERGYVNTSTANPNYSLTAITTDTSVASGSRNQGTGTASAAVTNLLYTMAFPVSISRSGKMQVYNGTTFVARPVKVWSGTAWVIRPVKVWDGSAWITAK